MPDSLKQKLINSFLNIYLFPVKISARLKKYVREVTLMDAASHLSKPVHYLKSHNLVDKNSVVIDIGGASGDTTSYFLKLLPESRVFTFEANPQLAEKIKNKFNNEKVKVFGIALSDKNTELTFYVTDNSLSSSYKPILKNEQFQTTQSIKVPARTLDSIMQNEENISTIDILKIDVQGAESDVLNGAGETLKKTKLVIVEQSVRSPYQGASMYFEVDEFLRTANFDLLDIVITYRKDGLVLTEFDSIYINKKYSASH